MRTEVGVRQECEEAGKGLFSNGRVLLAYSLVAMMSAIVMGGNVEVSRANPVRLASIGAAENFVVLPLKNYSTIAARTPQETLSSRYDVVSKPVETMAPAPWLCRAPARDAFVETFAPEAACKVNEKVERCPASMALLQSERDEWSLYSDLALPSLNESRPAVTSVTEKVSALTVGVTAPVGRVETTTPAVEPMPVGSEFADALTLQAAGVTGGLFDTGADLAALLRGGQPAWPDVARAAAPEAPLTTASLSHAPVAGARELASLTPHDIIPPYDRQAMGSGEVIVGVASTYNPYDPDDNDAGGAETASGEIYDPLAWTAAIQIDLRDKFAGVRYGRLYKPRFALVELDGKRAIVKINDVGPLRPGRVIDFNTRVMRYFDPSMRLGVLDGVLVTPLIGTDWTPGPLDMERAVAVASSAP